MPSLTFGVFGWNRKGGAHQPNEYVSIDDLMVSTKLIALTMMDWCGYERIKS